MERNCRKRTCECFKITELNSRNTRFWKKDKYDYDFSDLLEDLDKIEGLERIRISSIEIVELNDKYFLINEKEQELNDIKYDYMYYIDNYIVAIYNNKIDILNENLDSKLIMKIDTEYSYTNSNERNSLNINSDKEYIYFSVYKDEKYIKYKYSKERNAISY